MNEVNWILNDESNNDKQMIKELSTYIKNHRDKGLPINKKFVKDIVGIVAQNSELDYGSICFINDNKSIASFSLSPSKNLNFNINVMMKWAKLIRGYDHWQLADNRIIAYHYVLATIIHELTHARQFYLKDDEGHEMYKTFYDTVSEEMYNGNERKFLIERYAAIRGYDIAFQVLSYIYPLEKIRQLQTRTLVYLLDDYVLDEESFDTPVVISAIDTHNSIMRANGLSEVSIPLNENMTLYDRLYLGLPITFSEYIDMDNLFCDLAHNNAPVKRLDIKQNKVKKE